MKNKKSQAEFIKWFGSILDALRELGGSGKPREVSNKIAEMLKLPDDIVEETLTSGIPKFHNQVCWGRQYLVWEGYLDASKKGIWTLTEKGQNSHLTVNESGAIVSKWVKFFQDERKKKSETDIIEEQQEAEPDEYEASNKIDLLETLQKISASGFEQVCALLLRESGFENVVVTGRSHDGGFDGYGTLVLNSFVTMKVLFQCKRYQGTVSRAQIGDFRNSMLGRAEKGIILTTGTFSRDAIQEANRDGAQKIELIDGESLIEMFKKNELGIKPKTIYEVDLNFFEKYR